MNCERRSMFSARANVDIYDLNFVCVRDRDDYIPAKYLTKAIEHVFEDRHDVADQIIAKAFDLSPNYFEVHRIRAFAFAARQEFFLAKNEYEAAIALAGDRAPLRLWYGGLLSRSFDEQEAALEQILKAEQVAPNAAPVKLELGRLFQILHRFDESAACLSSIKDGDRLPAKLRRIFIDLSIQNNRRKAEYLAGNAGFTGALKCLQDARDVYEAAPKTLIDARTQHNLTRAWRTVSTLKRAFMGLPEQRLVDDFSNWLMLVGSNAPQVVQTGHPGTGQNEPGEAGEQIAISEEEPRNRGRLVDLRTSFGFVEMRGQKIFFHKLNWTAAIDFRLLGEGTVVQFDVDRDRAVNVSPVGEQSYDMVMGKRFLGAVGKLHSSHGFLSFDTGGEIFFGRTDCESTTRFSRLIVGDRVRFRVAIDKERRLHAANVELYSGTAT
jgi:LuxR family transcriptional regulator, glucitol operon activator